MEEIVEVYSEMQSLCLYITKPWSVPATIYDETHFKKQQKPSNQPPFPGKGRNDNHYNYPRYQQPSGSSSTAMELDHVSVVPQKRPNDGQDVRLTKLTPQEKQRLIVIGACFKCRLTGHVSSQCPSRTDNQGNTHQPFRQRLSVNAVDHATSTADLSGNGNCQ